MEARRAHDRERKRLAKLRPKSYPPQTLPGPLPNEAAAAVDAGARKKSKASGAGSAEPKARAPGWLRKLLEADEASPAASQVRHTALLILKKSGLPWAQEVLDDPTAKDSDKSRAVDLLAKLSVGYMTPDLAGGEDAPELPPPIIELSTGDLPGEGIITDGSLSEEDAAADDRAGPQLATSAAPAGSASEASAGPVPHLGVA